MAKEVFDVLQEGIYNLETTADDNMISKESFYLYNL